MRTDVIKALEGNPIASFSLKTLDGGVVTESNIKGKITVMNFWCTGCKPCIREIPELNKLVETFGNSVNFYAPALDDYDKVKAFEDKREFKYESLPDSKAFNELLGINVYPTHLVLDKDGVVRKVLFGAKEDVGVTLENTIRELN